MKNILSNFLRALRRGGFAIGTGVFLGLIAAFGLIAPVFVQHPVVHATPADALPPCPSYQKLLDDHLTVMWAKDGDVRRPVMTTFDYARLALYPDGKAKLDAARKELLEVRPSRLGPAARLAWGINTHNLLVICAITGNGFPDGKAVADAREAITQDETHPLVRIEGIGFTLHGFDRHFLFPDSDRTSSSAPPRPLNPRVHFALTTGARGGPPLHPKAYRPETLDQQLDDVTRGALLGSKHFNWNGMTKTLAVSRIFELSSADFGGPDSAFAFVMRHIPVRTADQIRAAGITSIPGFIDPEWTLNQTPTR